VLLKATAPRTQLVSLGVGKLRLVSIDLL